MKEINYRKCIACGKIKNKIELIKITCEYKTKDVVIQPDNKTFGHSCYICKNELCINRAVKRGKIFKILRVKSIENFDKKIKAVLN